MPDNMQSRGVRKSSERIMMQNRTLVITEPDASKLDWSTIPDGTLMVDPETGHTFAKVIGQSDWVPTNIKNDGTVSIARDNIIVEEVFTIKDPGPDTEGNFTYYNTEGHERRMPRLGNGGFVFELERGSYLTGRNLMEVYVDDLMHRTATSGGLQELSETRFVIFDKLEEGQEITARYSRIVRIGSPYPRFFAGTEEPEVAEIGDIWIDFSEKIDDDVTWEVDDDNDENQGTKKIYEATIPSTGAVTLGLTGNMDQYSVRVLTKQTNTGKWVNAYDLVRVVCQDNAIRIMNTSGERLPVRIVVNSFFAFASRDMAVPAGSIQRLTIDNFFASDTRIYILDEDVMSDSYGHYVQHDGSQLVVSYFADGLSIYNATAGELKIRVVSNQLKDVAAYNTTLTVGKTATISMRNAYSEGIRVYAMDNTINSRTGNDFTDFFGLCSIECLEDSIKVTNLVDTEVVLKVIHGRDDAPAS